MTHLEVERVALLTTDERLVGRGEVHNVETVLIDPLPIVPRRGLRGRDVFYVQHLQLQIRLHSLTVGLGTVTLASNEVTIVLFQRHTHHLMKQGVTLTPGGRQRKHRVVV